MAIGTDNAINLNRIGRTLNLSVFLPTNVHRLFHFREKLKVKQSSNLLGIAASVAAGVAALVLVVVLVGLTHETQFGTLDGCFHLVGRVVIDFRLHEVLGQFLLGRLPRGRATGLERTEFVEFDDVTLTDVLGDFLDEEFVCQQCLFGVQGGVLAGFLRDTFCGNLAVGFHASDEAVLLSLRIEGLRFQ